jgi:hypothetical protein
MNKRALDGRSKNLFITIAGQVSFNSDCIPVLLFDIIIPAMCDYIRCGRISISDQGQSCWNWRGLVPLLLLVVFLQF